MTAEYALGGIYVAAAPVAACIALVIALLLHRGLIALGAYRWVWHPVLFDTALFVVVWALIAHLPL